MLTLPERGTTALMDSDRDEAQIFCVFYAFYLFTAIIDICETITSGFHEIKALA